MIAYLPKIYPDELVYSWLCRYYVHSGCINHKMAMQELFCKRSDQPSKEFIGNLNPEARKRIEASYPLDMLVLNHTMYPQYARFVTLEQRKAAIQHIKHASCDIHQLFPVLPRIECEQFLRYCPLCAAEDRHHFGETYWHRRHQLRSVYICTKHGCKLVATQVSAKNEHDYTFHPAEDSIHEGDVVYEHNQQAKDFALYVEAVFDAPIAFERDVPASAILYHGMGRTKYLKPSGRSRYTQMLADDMRVYYQKQGLCNVASMYQVQRTLIGEQNDFSVICQIAFFLGISSEELTSPSLSKEQVQMAESSHPVKNTEPVDWDSLDAETLPVLEKLARLVYDGSASDIGRPERVTERLVYRELGLRGHQLENMPRCRAVLAEYAESYADCWARKIVWAYEKLTNEGVPFYWSDIRRLTGIKKNRFHEIIPYLIKYAEIESVERIIALTEGELVDTFAG